MGDRVPDAKTIWLYRDTLTKANVIRGLFDLFNKQLEEAGLITHTGTIADATFVEAPRRHDHHDENDDIKRRKIPEEWKKPEKCNKSRKKDVDARWYRKWRGSLFGYSDRAVYADSACWGSVVAAALPQNVENHIHERGTMK